MQGIEYLKFFVFRSYFCFYHMCLFMFFVILSFFLDSFWDLPFFHSSFPFISSLSICLWLFFLLFFSVSSYFRLQFQVFCYIQNVFSHFLLEISWNCCALFLSSWFPPWTAFILSLSSSFWIIFSFIHSLPSSPWIFFFFFFLFLLSFSSARITFSFSHSLFSSPRIVFLFSFILSFFIPYAPLRMGYRPEGVWVLTVR